MLINTCTALPETRKVVQKLLDREDFRGMSGGMKLAQTFGAFALKLAGRDEKEAETYLEYGNYDLV